MNTRDIIDIIIEENFTVFNMLVSKKYRQLFIRIYCTMVDIEVEKNGLRNNSKKAATLKETLYEDTQFFAAAIAFTLKLVHEIQYKGYFFNTFSENDKPVGRK